jgi:hypothetical protein
MPVLMDPDFTVLFVLVLTLAAVPVVPEEAFLLLGPELGPELGPVELGPEVGPFLTFPVFFKISCVFFRLSGLLGLAATGGGPVVGLVGSVGPVGRSSSAFSRP